MVNGKQMEVIWHVDDLKVSHVDPKENTKFANWMKEMYGENSQSTVEKSMIT
jgi:hypothetical protein